MSNIQRTLEILHYTNNIRLTNAETAEEAPEREISGMSAPRIFSRTAGEGKIIGMYIYACFHTNKKRCMSMVTVKKHDYQDIVNAV